MNSLELFSGGGGLALGVERAGFEHLCLVEADQNSCATLRHNRPNWNIQHSDVRNVNLSALAGRIDLLAAGAPCQPFSLGGKHAGKEDRRNLFPEVIRVVRETLPRAFLLENVRGLTRQSFLPYFKYIIAQLKQPTLAALPEEDWFEHHERLGRAVAKRGEYRVWHKVLNAADYGVPQMRQRVIIVGFRADLEIDWTWPSETHSRGALEYAQKVSGEYWLEHGMEARRDRLTSANMRFATEPRWRTVRDALSGLPNPVERLTPSHPDHNYVPGARPYAGHTGSTLDLPSKTLKAGDHGVPGGENTVIADDGLFRYLTVREAARLQTFPDEWAFRGSRTESMRQIGNAVPVQLAEHFGRAIRSLLSVRQPEMSYSGSPSSAITASSGVRR